MFKSMLVFLMLASALLAQDKQQKFEPGILTGVIQYYWDGNYQVLESPFAAGVKYMHAPFDLGAYLAPVIKKDNGQSVSNLSFIIHGHLFGVVGAGIGYKFWVYKQGLVEPRKDNMFFSVNISLK